MTTVDAALRGSRGAGERPSSPTSDSSAATLTLTIGEVLTATGARLVSGGGDGVSLHGVSLHGVTTDGRAVPEGSLFVALVGERFDGADFAAQAVEAGARAVLVNESRADDVARSCDGATVLAVESTLRALAMLAGWHRRRMPATVVALTGSNGKTTTKEFLRAALAGSGPVLATEGNLNNEIGAPLTLLGLRQEHRFAVLELGMNHEGEIARLTAMARPQVGLVTNVAEVHLEGLGSIEGVSRAKGELFHGLPLDGVAVANADDPLVLQRAKWAARKIISFGTSQDANVRLKRVVSHDIRGLRLDVEVNGREVDVTLPVVGVHNASNACAALAAAIAAGVEPDPAIRGLATARPPGRRLRLSPIPGTDSTLLDDCYNANPASTLAALKTLEELAPEGQRIAVLGDMRELGPEEERAHAEVGAAAAASGLSLLVAFGPLSRALATAALDAGLAADRVLHTEDPDEAVRRVRLALGAGSPGSLVLVKASRGTRLERVSDALAPPQNDSGALQGGAVPSGPDRPPSGQDPSSRFSTDHPDGAGEAP